ncbi:aminotransferase [Microbacterium sp. NPDC077663]|uniref:aminotransferase n=1 Tax=Microbacterium sp. NPDC077663 TaxID=3364189 RepID=UPI0037CB2992
MTDDSPFLLARPNVDHALAGAFVREHWRVEGEVHELGSQQDRNYAVTAPTGHRVLLKVHHPSTTAGEIDLQLVAADRLTDAGIRTPSAIPARDGSVTLPLVDGDGVVATARVLEFVEGSSLADGGAMDGAVAERLGRTAGRAVAALAGIEHPAAERGIQWDLRRALEVVESLIDDLPPERRDACLEAARDAAARVAAVADALPLQVVHGDLTADNVMRTPQDELYVVDLGDVGRSWRVAEIAILAGDVLARTESLAATGRAVSGFAAEAELSDDEVDALWPLVVLRGAVLAVSGWSQLRIDGDNDYARERVEHEAAVLNLSSAIPHDEATAALRLALGRPHRRDVAYAPLVDGWDAPVVLDLGITSPQLDEGRWTEPDAETRLARDARPASGVAVARFGEARLTRVPWDVSAPAAARARIVEVWAEPAAAVRAPFAGTVSVVDDSVELRDRGVVLRVDGLEPSTGDGPVAAGGIIGRVARDGAGLRVSRRIRSAAPSAPFGGPDDEYETDAAADPSPLLGLVPAPDPTVTVREARVARERAMGGASERYYAEPPQFERAWGTRFVDVRGRAYLDLVNNVTAIGHSHPVFVDRVTRQLRLLNTNSRFLYAAYARFTEKLLARVAGTRLDTVIPVNSGSEAVDLALRLAQLATGRREVIALREGYHGWTMGADAVTTSAFDNPAALDSRPDWVHLADAPNTYRGPHRGPDAAAAYAAQVAQIADRLAAEGRPAAAFISEPVLGNAGGVIPPAGYLPAVYDAIREHGGLAIADEIQVGLGRLGDAFWGWQLLGAEPDIVTVAKAAGNAYPLGAVITRREIVDALRDEGKFFSSAGGAPAGAVAGEAVLDVIEAESLQENARVVGAHLRHRLEELAARHPLIGTVHGTGLYLGVELVRDGLVPATAETADVCERLLDEGIIMQLTSERSNVLKVKPPLTLTREDADEFVDALGRVLGAL